MSKYDPLVRHLDEVRKDRIPMTFKEVECILGVRLPTSARRHQAWWANNGGSHVHAGLWMKRGWRTSAVDLAGETVTFVRTPGPRPGPAGASNGPAEKVVIAWSDLHEGQRSLLQAIAREKNVGMSAAVAEALDMALSDRRRCTLEWAAANASKVPNPSNSADLIREDRDRDEH